MLAEDYDAAVQHQYQLMQVLLTISVSHLLSQTALLSETYQSCTPTFPCWPASAQPCLCNHMPHLQLAKLVMFILLAVASAQVKHRPAFCRWQEVCLSSCRCSLGLANGCWLAVQTKALPIMTSSSYCLLIGASMSTPVDTLVPSYGYRSCLVSNAQMLKVANPVHLPPPQHQS